MYYNKSMYSQEKTRRVQLRLLEMAKSIRDILERHDIPYFITYGTLLGAVRHQGFIPWDDDFDFYLLAESYGQAMMVLNDELPDHLFLENEKTEPLYFHGWAHVKDLRSVADCSLFPQDNSYSHRGISVDLYKATKVKECEEKVFLLNEHINYLKRREQVGLIEPNVCKERLERLCADLEMAESIRREAECGKDVYVFPSIYDDRLYPEELFPLRRYRFEDTEFYGPNDADAFLKRCYGDYMKLPPVEKRVPHYSDVEFL